MLVDHLPTRVESRNGCTYRHCADSFARAIGRSGGEAKLINPDNTTGRWLPIEQADSRTTKARSSLIRYRTFVSARLSSIVFGRLQRAAARWEERLSECIRAAICERLDRVDTDATHGEVHL
jgi:hypothetical protein